MIIEGRSPNFETYHELNLFIWIGHLSESILDSSIFIRYVRTTAHLSDMLTRGAFTTLQFKSLMRLFDIHPPSHLNVDHSLCEESCAALFFFDFEAPLALTDAYSAHRDFTSGPWEEKAEDSSFGVPCAWVKTNARTSWFLKLRLEKPNAVFFKPCLGEASAVV